MIKFVSIILLTVLLSGCELYKFGGEEKASPTGGSPTGTVGDAQEIRLIQGSNQTALVNSSLGTAFEVKASDPKSRPIVGESIIFTLLDNLSNVIFTQTVVTNDSGIASLNFTPSVFGEVTVRINVANSKNVVAPIEVPLVVIGEPFFITITSGNNQTINAGAGLSDITYELRDENGRLVPNGQATINGTVYTANSSGIITYNHSSASTTTGTYNLTTTLPSTQNATFTYNIEPSAPANINFISGNNQNIVAGGSFSDWVIEITDLHGNPVPNVVVNRGLSVGLTDSNGRESFTPTVDNTIAGSYSLTVDAPVSGLSSTINYSISAGVATSLTITSNSSQTITAGQSLGVITSRLTDFYGNIKAVESITFDGVGSLTNASGVASFSGGLKTVAGDYNITVAYGALSQTATYTVSPASPSVMTIVLGNSQTITAGGTLTAFEINLKDAHGNNNPSTSVSFGGTTATTNSSGNASYSHTASTTTGTHTVTATVGSLSQTFSYTVNAGALAVLELVSGDNQVLPRGENSSSLSLRGKDNYSNLKSGDTISFSDNDSWSTTATLNGSGVASVVYPTPLLTGVKTITASSGGVTLNFTLTVNNYAPLTAVVATTDDLTYSIITERTYTAGEFLSFGITTVTNASILATSQTLTKSGTGVVSTDGTVAETNLNTSILNVSSASDILTITSTATFPAGVTGSSCSQINNVVDGLTCVVNGAMTFRRDSILGGDFSIKVNSLSLGGAYDFLNSNTLTATKKIIIKKYQLPAGIADVIVAGGDTTEKFIYFKDNNNRPSVFKYDSEDIYTISSSMVAEGRNSVVFGGKYYFNATNPNDTNQIRYLVYNPSTDTVSEAFRITTGADTVTTVNIFENNLYVVSGASNRKPVVIALDGSTTFNVATTSVGAYIPFRRFAGVEYGYMSVLTAGIYKRTTATAVVRVYQDSVSGPMKAETTNNGFYVGASGYLFRYNDTTFTQVNNKVTTRLLQLGDKMLVATKDSANLNKIFVYNDSDNSYKKLLDLNSGANDYTDGSISLIGTYNNNAYLCLQKGVNWTIYSYNGTKLSQLADSGINCSRLTINSVLSSAVVDNALWFGANNALFKICDQNLGCN